MASAKEATSTEMEVRERVMQMKGRSCPDSGTRCKGPETTSMILAATREACVVGAE